MLWICVIYLYRAYRDANAQPEFNFKFCWGIHYLLGVGMERKKQELQAKGAKKTAMSLVLALFGPFFSVSEIASTQK